jgi:hypothetical protein
MGRGAVNISRILDRLSNLSLRPRYAFAVLSLLAERAGADGKVGPFIEEDGEVLSLRVWVGKQLARTSSRTERRKQVKQRIQNDIAQGLPDDPLEAQAIVELAVEEHVRATGADNFSRVITELERAGYLVRYYEGYNTNHTNRGGGRYLVCVLNAEVSAALRRRDMLF